MLFSDYLMVRRNQHKYQPHQLNTFRINAMCASITQKLAEPHDQQVIPSNVQLGAPCELGQGAEASSLISQLHAVIAGTSGEVKSQTRVLFTAKCSSGDNIALTQ